MAKRASFLADSRGLKRMEDILSSWKAWRISRAQAFFSNYPTQAWAWSKIPETVRSSKALPALPRANQALSLKTFLFDGKFFLFWLHFWKYHSGKTLFLLVLCCNTSLFLGDKLINFAERKMSITNHFRMTKKNFLVTFEPLRRRAHQDQKWAFVFNKDKFIYYLFTIYFIYYWGRGGTFLRVKTNSS